MGKGGKAQTIGYKYYLGMHLVFCHGPIDKITRFRVDGRDAWTGSTTGGAVNVQANDLFGGEKREGGVSGIIDVEMGGPAQGKNSYLVSKLGALIPAYRRVVGAVFRQCYLGNNPYLKTWAARGQRVYVRQDGIPQWNSTRAGIASFSGASTVALAVVLSWWQSSFHPADNDHATMGVKFYNSSGVEIGSAFAPMIGTPNGVWTQRTLDTVQPVGTSYLSVFMQMQRFEGSNNDGYIDDISLSVGGVASPLFNPGAEDGTLGWTNEAGAIGARASGHGGASSFFGGTSAFSSAYQQIGVGQLDLNGAHIIRECLTDPDWGMGYTDEDIDHDSFEEAAEVFFAEGLGLSMLWDKQIPIEDFVQTVQRHVDCAVYVSRTTGKYVIKPIRGGYNEDDLLTLDESNIVSVDDPVRIVFGELTNSVTVAYWDAETGKDASVTVTDTALVQQQGVVINAPLQYPGFTNARNASIAAQRDLRALSSPLLSCTITADSDAKVLNVGDVFKFSWARWGIIGLVMRVTGIAYGTGRNNRVKINCTQDVFDTETSVAISVPTPDWVDPSAPPSAVPNQVSIEAPYFELVQILGQSGIDSKLIASSEIGFVIAAGSRPASAINASVLTDNGGGYADVGALDFAASGVLATDLNKVQTAFILDDGTDLTEVIVGTHFQVGDELMRVDNLDPVTGAIEVGRGVLDTVPQDHLAGSVALFWDQDLGFDPTEYVEGEQIDVKIIPVSGSGVLPVGEAEPMTVTMASRAFRPYPPGDLRVDGDSYLPDLIIIGEIEISWTHRDRLQQTSGILVDATEASIGPEPGTLYRLQGYVDDVLVHTEDDIATDSVLWTPIETGRVRVEVHSKRDGVYSLFAPSHTFLNVETRLTEDADTRYTEDSGERVMED